MQLLPVDERFLQRALALAQGAAAFASPNPAVGCVLTREDREIAAGAHRYNLRDHAEIVALKTAAASGQDVRGATAYVTLEPCSHQGRTGPCSEALITAGIMRCVVATVDPNPQVSGRGLTKLRAAGVEVVVADPLSPLAQSARRLNDAFAFSIQHGRPFVTLKAAISADGKLAPRPSARSTQSPFWLTGPAARADVQRIRYRSDALLTGIGTVLADDPMLTDRTGLERRRLLLRVVLDSDLRTPLHSKLVQSAQEDLLLLTAETSSPEREDALKIAGAEVRRVPALHGRLDLRSVIATLAAVSITSLMVEAGSALNGSLLAQDLVDEVILYQAPVELGPDALPLAQGQPSPEHLLERLTSVSRQHFSNGDRFDLRTSGYLHDPWIGVSP
ncbi:MAG: bifunctional diaminohydroxyphosphoribosylaminopyrimidine deaminase/5-amino-6-(5-phosphoribosylamino)uracil reductase RibD [Janthinobacterium lividum]